VAVTAQRFKEGALVDTEGVQTGGAIKAVFHMTMHLDVARIHSAKVATVGLITPLAFWVHAVSPPCAETIRF
jgi:hypothetical protein